MEFIPDIDHHQQEQEQEQEQQQEQEGDEQQQQDNYNYNDDDGKFKNSNDIVLMITNINNVTESQIYDALIKFGSIQFFHVTIKKSPLLQSTLPLSTHHLNLNINKQIETTTININGMSNNNNEHVNEKHETSTTFKITCTEQCGFVSFKNPLINLKLLNNFNSSTFHNHNNYKFNLSLPFYPQTTTSHPLTLDPAHPHNYKYQDTNLYIRNLNELINDDLLNNFFKEFGKIISAKIITDEKTGKSCLYGFVCFETHQMAELAQLKMNDTVLMGHQLHVSFARRRDRSKNITLPNNSNYTFNNVNVPSINGLSPGPSLGLGPGIGPAGGFKESVHNLRPSLSRLSFISSNSGALSSTTQTDSTGAISSTAPAPYPYPYYYGQPPTMNMMVPSYNMPMVSNNSAGNETASSQQQVPQQVPQQITNGPAVPYYQWNMGYNYPYQGYIPMTSQIMQQQQQQQPMSVPDGNHGTNINGETPFVAPNAIPINSNIPVSDSLLVPIVPISRSSSSTETSQSNDPSPDAQTVQQQELYQLPPTTLNQIGTPSTKFLPIYRPLPPNMYYPINSPGIGIYGYPISNVQTMVQPPPLQGNMGYNYGGYDQRKSSGSYKRTSYGKYPANSWKN